MEIESEISGGGPSHPQRHNPPKPKDLSISTWQTLYQHGKTIFTKHLNRFIHKRLAHSLGEDFAQEFHPAPIDGSLELLSFILNKWIAVFSDSPLGGEKELVESFYQQLRKAEKTVNPLSQREVKIYLSTMERILSLVRASGPAAGIARLKQGDMSFLEANQGEKKVVVEGGKITDGMEVENTGPFIGHEVPVPSRPDSTGLVVLDASNIAWEHGKSKYFSPRGIVEAYLYYVNRRHPTVIFLPRSRLKQEQFEEEGNMQESDAMAHLQSLEGTSALVLTPTGEYDDVYALYFAKHNGGIIVSNDKYTDMLHQAAADGEETAKNWKEFLGSCRVGFTFQGHDFMPNPHFDMMRAFKVAASLKEVS